tara:strand:- start:475 stop:1359 length:885 start_codon:yes stop_codon:yes gene_type:complete
MSVNKVENWLYFRNVTDADDDDGDTSTSGLNPSSICVPASSVKSIEPASDTGVEIHWNGVRVADDPQSHQKRYMHGATTDGVKLDVAQGRTEEVLKVMGQAINSYVNKDGFIVVADDCVTDIGNNTIEAEYLSPHLNTCGNIFMNAMVQGRGMHEYFEIVTPMTADDNDVAASLSISIPTPCVILEAALMTVGLATNNIGSVGLEFHNAAIADDAASGGTELVGADSTATSIPDGDLDISSDATFPAIITNQNPVSRTDNTFFHVTAKADCSTMTGTPKVGVYVRWFGREASAI